MNPVRSFSPPFSSTVSPPSLTLSPGLFVFVFVSGSASFFFAPRIDGRSDGDRWNAPRHGYSARSAPARPGVGNAWHLDYVASASSCQKLPNGLRACFPADGASTWIVLRHGFRAWPIEVINFEFHEGWDTFRDVHALRPEFKLIMSCERKWIFHTTILNENDRELVYQWSAPNPQWREFHSPPGYLRLECESCLHEVFDVFDLEDMVIHMANRTWEIKIQDLKLNVTEFDQFWHALDMDLLDIY